MGLSPKHLRKDGKAGSIDLAVLASTDDERPFHLSFRTVHGFWYKLEPTSDTEIQSIDGRDDQIYPVKLSFPERARRTGNAIEESAMVMSWFANFIRERRKFRAGIVAVRNTVLAEGSQLEIDGLLTSPLDVAWSHERVEKLSSSHNVTISDYKDGQILEGRGFFGHF